MLLESTALPAAPVGGYFLCLYRTQAVHLLAGTNSCLQPPCPLRLVWVLMLHHLLSISGILLNDCNQVAEPQREFTEAAACMHMPALARCRQQHRAAGGSVTLPQAAAIPGRWRPAAPCSAKVARCLFAHCRVPKELWVRRDMWRQAVLTQNAGGGWRRRC